MNQSLLQQIIQRRRELAQQEQEAAKLKSPGGGPLGFIGKAADSVADTVTGGAGKVLGGLNKASEYVADTPVPLAYEARQLLKGNFKEALLPDQQKKYDEPFKLGTPRDVATKQIRIGTDDLSSYLKRRRQELNIGTPLGEVSVSTAPSERLATLGGRGLEGVANIGLDPVNLLGIGIAGKAGAASKGPKAFNVAAEFLGRGTQSPTAYLKALGIAGFGSGVGGEVAGTPGALLGGFGAGWAGASVAERRRLMSEAAKIDSAKLTETTRNMSNIPGVSEGIRKAFNRYETFKAADGNEYRMLDEASLEKQIADREAATYSPGWKRQEQITQDSYNDTTEALKATLQYMRESGSARLPVADPVDFGRSFRAALEGDQSTARRFAEQAQAAQRDIDLEQASGKFGDFRYQEEQRGRLADIVKRAQPQEEMVTLYHGTNDPAAAEMLRTSGPRPGTFLTTDPDLAASYGGEVINLQVPKSQLQADDLQRFNGKLVKNYTYQQGSQFGQALNTPEAAITRAQEFDQQLKLNKEAEAGLREQVKQTQAARKAQQEAILQQMPSGARTAARNYLSALISGTEIEKAAANLQKRAPGIDIEQAANDFVELHRAAGEAETGLKDLLASRTDLGANAVTAKRQAEELVKKTLGQSVKQLQDRVVQIKGQGGRYRVKGVAIRDGQIGLEAEYIAPSKSIEESIGEGLLAKNEQAEALRNARAEIKELKKEQALLRREGGDPGDIVERIRAAEQQAKDLELVRPSTAKNVPGRQFIPLNDAREFIVYKPSKQVTPKALTDLGIRDARTIKLMNEESKFRVRAQTAERNLEALNAERERVMGRLAENPESLELTQRLDQIEETIAGTQADLDLNNAELERINQSVVGSQQTLEATLSAAKEEAENARRLYEESLAVRDENWKKFYETLQLSPDDAAMRFARNSEEINKGYFEQLKKETSGRRLTQGAYDQILADLDEQAVQNRAALSKPAQQAYGDMANSVSRMIWEAGSRNAVSRLITPKQAVERFIDPDAWRSGVGGFLRRNIMGTGLSNAETEGTLATYYNGKAAAGQIADMSYGGLERAASRVADNWLGTQDTEWSRAVRDLKDPLERNEAVLKNAAKPVTDRMWQKAFDGLDATDAEKQQIYDLLSGSFLHASRNPGAFDKTKLDPTFLNTIGQYGEQLRSIEDLAKSKGLMRNLIKENYREYQPQGRLFKQDGSIKTLKASERSDVTDLLEIIRNAQFDPKRAARTATQGPESIPNIAEMMVPAREWGTTQAANVLDKINLDATWDKVATWLNDPSAVGVLKQGRSIQPAEWKNTAYADDWAKIRDELLPTRPTGVYKWLDTAAQTMNKIAATTITGDGSFATVQGLIGAAMSPASTAKLLQRYGRAAFSDEGWMTLMADPTFRNKLIDRTNRGMGVGRASVTGVESGGNLFQQIPGLKRIGNGMAALDKVTFDRMQLLNKMNLIDTMEADIQMIRAFGPETAQQFVDGIPTLERLHKEANLFQSTPEEISNAIIRQANNSLGGLSKSQSLLGRNRQTLESTLLFVPGFFRARGGLINSVSKMLRNPNSPEGYLAASLLAREALFRISFAASIAEITGTQDEFKKEVDSWAALDPRKSGGILSGPLGDGGYMGLSWGNAAPKLYAQMLAGNEKGNFNLNPQDRLQAVTDFFEGRTNPVIGTVVDQMKGEDFMGRPVQSPRDRMFNVMQAITPMFLSSAAGEANEAMHTGQFDPATLGAQTAAEFMGLNVRKPIPSQQLNSRFVAWQQQKFPGEPPVDWRDAPSALKNMAREENKAIVDAEEDYTSELARRVSESASQRDIIYSAWDEKNAALDTEIARASQQLSAGQMTAADFKATYSSLQEDRADLAADMRAVLAKAGVQPRDEVGELGSKGSQLAHLMAEYNAIKPQRISGQQVTESGVIPDNDIDWTRFKQERQEVLGRYSPEVRAQFEATQAPDDPNVRRLQDARGVLDTYFDTLSKYKGLSNVEGKALDAYKSVLNASAAQYADMGVRVDRRQIFIQTLQKMQANGQISTPRQAQIAALAMRSALDSKFNASLRNMAAVQYLLQNRDAFQWYPWLEAEIPGQLTPLLGTQPVDTNAILERELRGADLSGVR